MSIKIISRAEVLDAAVPLEAPVRGIYFLVLFDEIFYVGQSHNCKARIEQHAKEKDFDSYAIFKTPENLDLDEVEGAHIAHHLPRLNAWMPQSAGLVSSTYLSRQKIVGKVQIRKWVQRGVVAPVYMGDGVFYRMAEIEAALAGDNQ